MTDEGLEPGVQALAQPGGATLVLAGGQHVTNSRPDGARERVATKGRSVLARLQQPEDLAVGDHR